VIRSARLDFQRKFGDFPEAGLIRAEGVVPGPSVEDISPPPIK
jgi:hypothetical protein